MNISMVAEFMMLELGITQIQMGQVFSAFLLGHAMLQIPMGILGIASTRTGCWRASDGPGRC